MSKRTIRLKEHTPGSDRWLTPSTEYRAHCDETLPLGPFRSRGTAEGFLDTGNARPDAELNLIMLGGSFVESHYSAEEDRFASIVERDLPPKWRVLNGGYSGMSTLHQASMLLTKIPRFVTWGSLVLVFVGQSDLEVAGQEGSYWAVKPRVTPIEPAPETPGAAPEGMDAVSRVVDAALAITESLQMPYAVVASPFRDGDFSTDRVLRAQYQRDRDLYRQRTRVRRDIQQAARTAAEDRGAPFFDGQAVVSPADFYDLMHLNRGGQARFAAALRDWLATWRIVDADTAHNADAEHCPLCGTAYLPVPGYASHGHQCSADGLADEHMLATP